MGYVRQDNFSFGEIDEINFNETTSSLYLHALKSGKNMLVSDTGKLKKRPGFKNVLDVSHLAITENSRLFGFLGENGDYWVIIALPLEFVFYNITTQAYGTNVVTPYTASQLQDLQSTNGEGELIFAHPEHIPARLQQTGLLFSYVPFSFAVQPAYDFGKVLYNPSTAVLSGTTTTFTLTFSAPSQTFTTQWIGGVVIGGGANSDDPIGYGIITGATSSVLTGTVKVAFKTGTFQGSDFSVRQPVFTTALGFPRTLIFFQGRLWFANTKSLKNTLFGSKINQFDNFDVGVGNPPDAIIETLGDTNVGEILFLNAGKQIEIYTRNKEYVAPQPSGSALTPDTFTVRPQSSYGINAICPPVTYENDSYYVGRGGASLFKFQFQGLGEAYASENISIAASHLIKQPKRNVIMQSTDLSQENYLFLVNPDFTLTVYQFSDISKVNAFMPLVFGENDATIKFYDIVNINNEIYLLVNLVTNGKWILARFDEDFYHDFYTVETLPENGVITGLTALEDYSVSVMYEGQFLGDYTVTGGQITVINQGKEGACTVGITYTPEVIPLSLFIGKDSTDSLKKSSYLYVDYFKSLDFRINGKLVPYQNFVDIQAGSPLIPQTGRARLGTAKGWQLTEDVVITQTTPLPLNILSISYQVEGELI